MLTRIDLAPLDDIVLLQVELVGVLRHWFNLRDVIRLKCLRLIVVFKNVVQQYLT